MEDRNDIMKCPVCGKERKEISLSEYDCEYCGFNNAFIRFFSSENAYNAWQASVKEAIERRNKKEKSSTGNTTWMWVGNHTIAFLDLSDHHLVVACGNGNVETYPNAAQFDSSERNYGVLFQDGTVRIFGEDNEFGQKNTEGWTDIRQIVLAANCTYGLRQDGSILYTGSPADLGVMRWKSIATLHSYEDKLICIHTDGNVVASAGALPEEERMKLLDWKNIQEARLIRDGAVGLNRDGKVLFIGKDDDPRTECTGWSDIVSIAVDHAYVYGLDRDGQVHVAGNCRKFLDQGRKNAGTWQNILAISCNKAGIGAVSESGEFLFAGTIAADKEQIVSQCNDYTKSATLPA